MQERRITSFLLQSSREVITPLQLMPWTFVVRWTGFTAWNKTTPTLSLPAIDLNPWPFSYEWSALTTNTTKQYICKYNKCWNELINITHIFTHLLEIGSSYVAPGVRELPSYVHITLIAWERLLSSQSRKRNCLEVIHMNGMSCKKLLQWHC